MPVQAKYANLSLERLCLTPAVQIRLELNRIGCLNRLPNLGLARLG
jgi:hypothetical protein